MCRKITFSFGGGENCRGTATIESLILPCSRSLIRAKEESVILINRAAERATKLVLVEHRRALLEEVLRIQERVPVKVEGISVEGIRARANGRVQDRPGVSPVFRIDGVRDHIEFADGVRTGNNQWRIQRQVVRILAIN